MLQDTWGDERAWAIGLESMEMDCEDCESPMELVDKDYTAKLALFRCSVCEREQKWRGI